MLLECVGLISRLSDRRTGQSPPLVEKTAHRRGGLRGAERVKGRANRLRPQLPLPSVEFLVEEDSQSWVVGLSPLAVEKTRSGRRRKTEDGEGEATAGFPGRCAAARRRLEDHRR